MSDYLAGWMMVVLSGAMLLHVAHAVAGGAINFDGDWISKTERPAAFRWAVGTEAFLALLILEAAWISL